MNSRNIASFNFNKVLNFLKNQDIIKNNKENFTNSEEKKWKEIKNNIKMLLKYDKEMTPKKYIDQLKKNNYIVKQLNEMNINDEKEEEFFEPLEIDINEEEYKKNHLIKLKKNILVFGEVCSGKSSLINYILNELSAMVTNRYIKEDTEFIIQMKSNNKEYNDHDIELIEYKGLKLNENDISESIKKSIENINGQIIILYVIDSSKPYFDERNAEFVVKLDKLLNNKECKFYFVFTKFRSYTGEVRQDKIEEYIKNKINNIKDHKYLAIDASTETALNKDFKIKKTDTAQKDLINYIKENDFIYTSEIKRAIKKFYKDESKTELFIKELNLKTRYKDDEIELDTEDEESKQIEKDYNELKNNTNIKEKIINDFDKYNEEFVKYNKCILEENIKKLNYDNFKENDANINKINECIKNIEEISKEITNKILNEAIENIPNDFNIDDYIKLINHNKEYKKIFNVWLVSYYDKNKLKIESLKYKKILKFLLDNKLKEYHELLNDFLSYDNYDDNYMDILKLITEELKNNNNSSLNYKKILQNTLNKNNKYINDCIINLLKYLDNIENDEYKEYLLKEITNKLLTLENINYIEIYKKFTNYIGKESKLNKKLCKKIFEEYREQIYKLEEVKEKIPEVFKKIYEYGEISYDRFEILTRVKYQKITDEINEYQEIMGYNKKDEIVIDFLLEYKERTENTKQKMRKEFYEFLKNN